MRLSLIILFCTISFSASAQWWHVDLLFKKKRIIVPYLQPVKDRSISRIKSSVLKLNPNFKVQPIDLGESAFTLQARSVEVMRQAKHNMRFRVYHDASYNFSDLAQLYVQLHRYSEAKWYFLQSNTISREENDDRHTISNLASLAYIKIQLGDVPSAHADLVEARDLAHARGFIPETADMEKKMQLLEQSASIAVKPDVKYAETTGNEKKAL